MRSTPTDKASGQPGRFNPTKGTTLNTSEAIIAFIADLYGMAPVRRRGLSPSKDTPGALDLLSGQTFEPVNLEGDMLLAHRQDGGDGVRAHVPTRRVVDAVLVRAAQALAVMQDGSVQEHYKHLKDKLRKETGLSY